LIISANTIGETAGDLISMTFNVGYAWSTVILLMMFAVAVGVAVWTKIQHQSIYWIVIILSSTAGTTLSDLVSRNLLGTPENPAYGASVLAILFTLALLFIAWHFIAPKHGIDKPLSRPSELFYWLLIATSSTLGTAFGDYLTHMTLPGMSHEVGFGPATTILAVALVAVTLLAVLTKIDRDFLYWCAIVVTHPLGATAGDLLTKDREEGGFELGTIVSTIILVAIFVLISIVAVMIYRRKPQEQLDGVPSVSAT
jgi:uncharacterized membrane-anchored protein